jgi:hypothetical protein
MTSTLGEFQNAKGRARIMRRNRRIMALRVWGTVPGMHPVPLVYIFFFFIVF